jgi:hypothetical protein
MPAELSIKIVPKFVAEYQTCLEVVKSEATALLNHLRGNLYKRSEAISSSTVHLQHRLVFPLVPSTSGTIKLSSLHRKRASSDGGHSQYLKRKQLGHAN